MNPSPPIPVESAAPEWSIIYGAANVTNSATFRWLPPGNMFSGIPPAGNFFSWFAPYNIECVSIQAYQGTPGGNGNRVRYAVQINGTPPTLFAELASTAFGPVTTLGAPLFIPAGARVDIQVSKPDGAIGGSGVLNSTVLVVFRKVV